MSMISMNDLFYGERESVLIVKDEDRKILETIHQYNYFYAEQPPKPEVNEEGEDPEKIAKEMEQPAQEGDEKKDVNEEKNTDQPEQEAKVALRVPMCCTECEETVTIVLKNVPGVENVETVLLKEMVTVTGTAAAADLLLACRDLKLFRKSQFWSHESD